MIFKTIAATTALQGKEIRVHRPFRSDVKVIREWFQIIGYAVLAFCWHDAIRVDIFPLMTQATGSHVFLTVSEWENHSDSHTGLSALSRWQGPISGARPGQTGADATGAHPNYHECLFGSSGDFVACGSVKSFNAQTCGLLNLKGQPNIWRML